METLDPNIYNRMSDADYLRWQDLESEKEKLLRKYERAAETRIRHRNQMAALGIQTAAEVATEMIGEGR